MWHATGDMYIAMSLALGKRKKKKKNPEKGLCELRIVEQTTRENEFTATL